MNAEELGIAYSASNDRNRILSNSSSRDQFPVEDGASL